MLALSFSFCFQTFTVTWAVALKHFHKFVPRKLAEIIMLGFFIPLQILIGNLKSQELSLTYGYIHKTLSQRIITLAFYTVVHRFLRVWRSFVVRSEHHQGRPPETVQGFLRKVFLLFGSTAKCHQDLVSLSLVKGFFLTYPHHGSGIRSVGVTHQHHLVHDR